MKTTDKNSMTYWWPKIKDLHIPKPRTEIVPFFKNSGEMYDWLDKDWKKMQRQITKFRVACRRMGNPVFIRSDLTSAKHSWNKSCYFDETKDSLINHLTEIITFSAIVNIEFRDLVVRKYIPMKRLFYAFHGNMPVNEEMRIFVKDGKYQCHHWYWIKDAIQPPSIGKLPDDWVYLIDKAEAGITKDEINLLKFYAEVIGVEFDGYWSIDFCKTAEDTWLMIDMALGKDSWHNDKCQYILK